MKPVALVLLRFYRLAISPSLGQHCRYYPSCSAYAVEAIGVHGVLRGMLLAAWRLLRCNPWARGGIDPVPPRARRSEGKAWVRS
jgi:putative membrane protein insertion efficiency factor